jgi:threonine/homoserine/homoserine lactone efflux protein
MAYRKRNLSAHPELMPLATTVQGSVHAIKPPRQASPGSNTLRCRHRRRRSACSQDKCAMEHPEIFVLSVIVVLLTPGPTNTLLAISGSTVGFLRSAHLLLGEMAGYALSILLIRFLLAPFVSGAYSIAAVLRIAAAIYLILVSIKLWRTPLRRRLAVVSIRQVFVTTLLNPKAIVFALVIIPLGSPHGSAYFLAFVAMLPALGTAWITVGTLLNQHAPAWLSGSFTRIASIVLAAFSIGLVTSVFVS